MVQGVEYTNSVQKSLSLSSPITNPSYYSMKERRPMTMDIEFVKIIPTWDMEFVKIIPTWHNE